MAIITRAAEKTQHQVIGETRCGARDLGLTVNFEARWAGVGSRMAGNLVQGAVFTVMVVRASMLRDPEFQDELSRQIDRSPRFFQNAPVVLDLKGADAFATAEEFAQAKELLRQYTLALVGVQNA